MSDMIVDLGQAYPSVWTKPVIHAVDTRIFRLRYFQPCLSCHFCNDHCCSYGVDVDALNADRLLALGPEFDAYVGVPREKWFAGPTRPDDEFPSGNHLRTATAGGSCVFHAPSGRGCKIHAWCLDHDLDYHLLKPMVSVLFPLTFERGVLVPSDEVLDGTLVCHGEGKSLYAGARDELLWFFGEGLIAALDALCTRSAQAQAAPGEAAARAMR